MPIRGVSNPNRNYNFDSDPNWINGSTYGTGLSYMSDPNPMYDAYYKANPFVEQTYNKTWIDKLFGGIFRTGYDKWLNEMQLNSAQYNAGVVDLQQSNLFNSEVAKAQRMRDAGENPDLLGTGDVSESAGMQPDVQDAQIPEAEGAQVLDIVSNVGMSLLDLIPKTMSFMTSLSELRGVRMENDLKELTFNSNIEEYVKDFFATGITKQDYEDAYSTENFENLLSASEKNSDDLAKRLFSSKRGQSKFKMNYGRYARSLVAEMSKYKSYEEFEEAREAINGTRASSYWSDDDNTQIELIKCILGPYEEFQRLFYGNERNKQSFRDPQLEQETLNAGLQTEKAYQETLDGVAMAQAENEQNFYTKQLYGILKDADQMYANIMQKLDDANKWWSPIAKALVGIARSQLLSGLHMQIGRHSASYTNPQSGAESSRSGFHFGF